MTSICIASSQKEQSSLSSSNLFTQNGLSTAQTNKTQKKQGPDNGADEFSNWFLKKHPRLLLAVRSNKLTKKLHRIK